MFYMEYYNDNNIYLIYIIQRVFIYVGHCTCAISIKYIIYYM